MDNKNTYETYQFIAANTKEEESDQLFVVQDDGTFFINRFKGVQEDVQSCTVYDVSSQQYYVDVDTSTQLISVSDPLILPEGESNIYASSYLLQPSSSTDVEQMEDVVDDYKQASLEEVGIGVLNVNNKEANNITEITLSDEQYQTLEQRGWILLESNDKIFVLNTLGLHDITMNDKLIQKLKNEIQNNTNLNIDGSMKEVTSESNDIQELCNQQNVEFIGTHAHNEENIERTCFIISNNEVDEEMRHTPVEKNNVHTPSENHLQNDTVEVYKEQDSSTIRIKTNFTFEDIPDKIVLGRTPNGKRLVAKVLKTPKKPVTIYEKIMENKHLNSSDLNESQFLSLIQHTLRCKRETKYATEDVAAADAIVAQLLKVPALRQSILGHNLVVTKIVYSKDATGKLYCKSKPMLVSGKSYDENQGFLPLPNLLHDLFTKSDTQDLKNDIFNEQTECANEINITHVHASETVGNDNVARVNVTLVRRQLANNSLIDYKTRRQLTTYACGACAATFKTTQELTEHQETQCMDTDDNLTIVADSINERIDTYTIVKNGREKLYCCSQCQAKFSRMSNCENHMKTHFIPTSPVNPNGIKVKEDQANGVEDTTQGFYKCKMCPGTFLHKSTLAKHIVTKHINLKSN